MMLTFVPIFTTALFSSVLAAPGSISTRAGGPTVYNIHPNGDTTKCVGLVGGIYANGSQITVDDCVQFAPYQWWQWWGNTLTTTNITDVSRWCLDAGNLDEGAPATIEPCVGSLPQQTWKPVTSSGPIALNETNLCLALPQGADADVLDIVQCDEGSTAQNWIFTPA